MLVLTRKREEAVRIDDSIRVVVLSITPKGVRLGIEAAASVPVHREEIWLALQGQGRKFIQEGVA